VTTVLAVLPSLPVARTAMLKTSIPLQTKRTVLAHLQAEATIVPETSTATVPWPQQTCSASSHSLEALASEQGTSTLIDKGRP